MNIFYNQLENRLIKYYDYYIRVILKSNRYKNKMQNYYAMLLNLGHVVKGRK